MRTPRGAGSVRYDCRTFFSELLVVRCLAMNVSDAVATLATRQPRARATRRDALRSVKKYMTQRVTHLS